MRAGKINQWGIAKHASIKGVSIVRVDAYNDTNKRRRGVEFVVLGFGFWVEA